jgi:uncharacterized membrane protein YphA (DoxX/SURF4 family)
MVSFLEETGFLKETHSYFRHSVSHFCFVKTKKNMKRDKIIYWILTGLIGAGMIVSGIMYLTKNPQITEGFKMMGYPQYFAMILGVAKLAGGIVLLAPLWQNLKEWAYGGFTFVFIGAIWTHIATSTPFVPPLIALLILAGSYWFWRRTQTA